VRRRARTGHDQLRLNALHAARRTGEVRGLDRADDLPGRADPRRRGDRGPAPPLPLRRINPQRTVLPAAAFAAALGLAGARATNVNDEHNIWNLDVDGTTRIRWRGLELEVNIDVDQGHGRSMALDGLAVSFMTIYPAKR